MWDETGRVWNNMRGLLWFRHYSSAVLVTNCVWGGLRSTFICRQLYSLTASLLTYDHTTCWVCSLCLKVSFSSTEMFFKTVFSEGRLTALRRPFVWVVPCFCNAVLEYSPVWDSISVDYGIEFAGEFQTFWWLRSPNMRMPLWWIPFLKYDYFTHKDTFTVKI